MHRKWINNIEPNKRILEIGPLAWPNIQKQDGYNVFYADIRSTNEIKELYKNDVNVPNDKIVDIDYVIIGEYSEALKNVEKFDYIIATHVIEHVPQLISFFLDISNVMNPQGKLYLAIPDKRYCFDHFRAPTSFSECYDIYYRKINNFMPEQVLDQLLLHTINDASYWWKNTNSFEHLVIDKKKIEDVQKYYIQALNGKYIDVHFSVFTPESFLVLIFQMLCFNLFPFKCVEFENTDLYDNEFNIVFELNKNILTESHIDNKIEKENIMNLLSNNLNNEYDKLMIEQLNNDLIKSKLTIEQLNNDLRNIQLSRSWRITAPLRKVNSILKNLKYGTSHNKQ